ncbi:protein of unknown function [Natronoarchaeum philippinense]|uniref:Protein-glutamine gamma-glutamyltransferase-like C-terminal domain-containing protein n=1 Tax=Natronoarchaeum philippinense TaxID=558529 RepID=A0A285NTA9_NATPI|nr:DUF4129 domain-containing protein [Natronoarchaeum philippinense]SNZ12679.1 protein of unknown function [Natronoarchaeum philippinense]
MEQKSLRTLAIALLCVLALVGAAATLETVQSGSDSGSGGFLGGQEGDSTGPIGGQDRTAAGANGQLVEPTCVVSGPSPAIIWAGVAATVVAGALVARRFGLAVTAVVAAALVPLALLLGLVLTSGCPEASTGPLPSATAASNGGGGGGGAGGGGSGEMLAVAIPALALLSVLLIAIGGGLVSLLFSTDEESSPDESVERVDDDGERRAEVGRAAGRAAERLDDADDFENEVYRAWREMADSLPVDHPGSSTPGEFAMAAREIGIDEADVDELTDVFEIVRYGGRDPTPDREERAVAALRRIEDEYRGDADA